MYQCRFINYNKCTILVEDVDNEEAMHMWGFSDGSVVKNPPANAGDATRSSILPWEIPWTGEPGGIQSMGSQESWTYFSRSVGSDSLWPHGLQQARLPCPSPTPRACSNSCPSSQWCHPTILSSVVPFSSCLQSFPASGSFPRSQFFVSDGQSIGVSASTSILPMNVQGWISWTQLSD